MLNESGTIFTQIFVFTSDSGQSLWIKVKASNKIR